jgi:hypothetical protein
MLYILKTWVVLHLGLHHWNWSAVFIAHIVSTIVVVIVVASTFVREVRGTFVFMCTAILKSPVSPPCPWYPFPSCSSYILEAIDDFVDVRGRVFI